MKDFRSKEAREEMTRKMREMSPRQAKSLIKDLKELILEENKISILPDIGDRIEDRQWDMGNVPYMDAAVDYLVNWLDHDAARGYMDAFMHFIKEPELLEEAKKGGLENQCCPHNLIYDTQNPELLYEIDRDKWLQGFPDTEEGEHEAELDFVYNHVKAWGAGRRLFLEVSEFGCPYRRECPNRPKLLDKAMKDIAEYNKKYYSNPEHATREHRKSHAFTQ